MDLWQYARILRAHWLLITVSVAVGTAAAAYLAWTRPPTYAARIQLFVSTSVPKAGADSSERYAAILLSQQRVVSYTQLVESQPVVQGIVRQLALSPDEFKARISASRPQGTVLINVTVRDRTPKLAKAIAEALGAEFPRFIAALETPTGQQDSPVKLSVTSPPKLPARPESPKKTLYLVLGALLGLVLGVGGAVAREVFAPRVRDAADAAAISGAPTLGGIVEHRRARHQPIVVVSEPDSVESEEYRRLRTNLQFMVREQDLRSFVVCSAVASEGKTLISANLGIAFAQTGHRVILVDADLRRSKLAEIMGLKPLVGLTDVLTLRPPVERALQTWRIGVPLEVLAAGRRPQDPSELLGSQRFALLLEQLTNRADIVILDTPSLLSSTDAAILAGLTSGAVLVARAGSTRVSQLYSAVESLRSVEATVLGVVMNRVSARTAGRRYGGTYAGATSSGLSDAVSPGRPDQQLRTRASDR